MKIDFTDYDLSDFLMKDTTFMGIDAVLINPQHQGCEWTQKNKIFRSSIWSKDGELLSAGFPKFTNFGENPDNFPVPISLYGSYAMDKLDGSLIVVDWVDEYISMRTRGTTTYETLDNSDDFIYCYEKYTGMTDLAFKYPEISWLYEITTPNNKIVLDYGDEPEITLIGGINKSDYSYVEQFLLDQLGNDFYLTRPITYWFNDLPNLIESIKGMTGIEGCVLYTDNGQTLHKIKSEEYLKYHFIRTSLNDNKLIQLIDYLDYPSYDKFREHITKEFDWECFKHIEDRVKMVYDIISDIKIMIRNAWRELNDHVNSIDWTYSDNRGDIARYINTDNFYSSYYKDYISVMFLKMDNRWNYTDQNCKNLLRKQIKKMINENEN